MRVVARAYPSPDEREIMLAFLNGYTETVSVVELGGAVAAVRRVTPATTEVDGMLVSRLLRKLGFNRSYVEGAGGTTYRRTVPA